MLFLPESAHGPTNQCIGLGKVLLDRGHRVVFAAERSWEGQLAPLGFVEALVDLAAPDPDASRGGRRPVLDRLHQRDVAGVPQADGRAAVDRSCSRPTRRSSTARCTPSHSCRAIIAEHRPDVLVEDNVVAFPALVTSGAPFVRIVSCNPLEVRGDGVAAGLLRLPGRRPVASGPPFLAEFDRTHQETWTAVRRVGAASRAHRRCLAATSSTPPRRPTCTSSPRSSTTSTPARSARPGTGSTPACARPTPTS